MVETQTTKHKVVVTKDELTLTEASDDEPRASKYKRAK